jgi:hypothetical protein
LGKTHSEQGESKKSPTFPIDDAFFPINDFADAMMIGGFTELSFGQLLQALITAASSD